MIVHVLCCLWVSYLGSLIIFYMSDFDVILGMTRLSSYYSILNSNAMTMTLAIPRMDKLEWEKVYKDKSVRIISFV